MKPSKTIAQGLRWANAKSFGNIQKTARMLRTLADLLEKRKRGDLTVLEINAIESMSHALATIVKADAIVKTVRLTHQGKETNQADLCASSPFACNP